MRFGGMPRPLRRLVVALAAVVVASLVNSCGEDTPLASLTGGKKNERHAKKPTTKDSGGGDEGGNDGGTDPNVTQNQPPEGTATDADPGDNVEADGEVAGKVTKTIDNSGADFQAKDVLLLKSSVESCMGAGMTTVQATMLLPDINGGATGATQSAGPDGRLKFLLPKKYTAGQDVIDAEKGNLVDTSGGARTGIAADSLTDTYLRALETIGNVVAHNCDAAKPECNCATKDDALAMLKRCLPGLDPETVEMHDAAQALSSMCATGPGGMRTAIASFIASYAFANAR